MFSGMTQYQAQDKASYSRKQHNVSGEHQASQPSIAVILFGHFYRLISDIWESFPIQKWL